MEDNTSKEKAKNRNVYVIELLVSEVKMAREERKQIKEDLKHMIIILQSIFLFGVTVSDIHIIYKITFICLITLLQPELKKYPKSIVIFRNHNTDGSK